MIVCSIIVDTSEEGSDIGKAFASLSDKGGFLTSQGVIYFASEDERTNMASVKRMLRKAGFGQSLIRVYDRDHLPKETEDPVIYGWLVDHVVRAMSKEFETKNQKALSETSAQLDKLQETLRQIKGTAASAEGKGNGGIQDGGKKD